MLRLRILHLTDTHLFGDDSRHYGIVDTAEHLRRALENMSGQRFDLVVCSGDVSEDGSEASYRRVREAIVPWARQRGARAVFAMGNHDRRSAFRAELGGGQPGTEEHGLPGEDPERPVVSVAAQDGWRVIVLDSSVPGRGYGSLEPEQLRFLRSTLSDPAERGTVLVLHHPPVAAQTDLLQALALDARDAEKLMEIVRGTDVRVILSGHYHLPIVEAIAGVPVVVAPGVANIARAFDDPAEEAAMDAFGGAVVEVHGDRVRVLPFIERMEHDVEVFRFRADAVAQILRDAGQDEPEAPAAPVP